MYQSNKDTSGRSLTGNPAGGHECLSFVNVVCFQVDVSCIGLITRPEESYRVCLSVIVKP
jgi:hypothetical protein